MTPDRRIPGWQPLTAIRRPAGYRLGAALFTTFDPPQPGVLIEDYLPAWLGLENAYTEEGTERLRYFAELEDELRRLKGRIAIVSTPGDSGTSAEAWIWSYIRRFEVGADERAVQHAKLWMFHWIGKAEGEPRELLELAISSANLTRDGLHNQLQAGWRCTVPLNVVASSGRSSSWGVLPEFLSALGAKSGASAAENLALWTVVLGRAQAPSDVVFIGSVPGTHAASALRSSRKCWGASALARTWTRKRPRLGVMAPTIGRWDAASLEAWCASAGVEPRRLSLAWIPPAHPWTSSWQLDDESERGLDAAGIRWLRIAGGPGDGAWESPFCDEHLETDRRWSHAKLYELRDGNRRSLLVTLANFSRSAWGEPNGGGLRIENFELGVVLPVREGFIDYLEELPAPRHTCEVDYSVAELPVSWLAAQWDGSSIEVQCRARSGVEIVAEVLVVVARADSPIDATVVWQPGVPQSAEIPWADADLIPLTVGVFTVAGESREVGVADVRADGAQRYLCGEFDEDALRDAADALLEERYGFVSASGGGDDGSPEDPGGGAKVTPTSYTVPAYEDARRRFALIDNWVRALEAETAEGRRWVLADGARIVERWDALVDDVSRDDGLRIAARIAVEEFRRRLGEHR